MATLIFAVYRMRRKLMSYNKVGIGKYSLLHITFNQKNANHDTVLRSRAYFMFIAQLVLINQSINTKFTYQNAVYCPLITMLPETEIN